MYLYCASVWLKWNSLRRTWIHANQPYPADSCMAVPVTDTTLQFSDRNPDSCLKQKAVVRDSYEKKIDRRRKRRRLSSPSVNMSITYVVLDMLLDGIRGRYVNGTDNWQKRNSLGTHHKTTSQISPPVLEVWKFTSYLWVKDKERLNSPSFDDEHERVRKAQRTC